MVVDVMLYLALRCDPRTYRNFSKCRESMKQGHAVVSASAQTSAPPFAPLVVVAVTALPGHFIVTQGHTVVSVSVGRT